MEAGKQTGGDMFANSKEGPKGCLDELSLWEVDAEDEDHLGFGINLAN